MKSGRLRLLTTGVIMVLLGVSLAVPWWSENRTHTFIGGRVESAQPRQLTSCDTRECAASAVLYPYYVLVSGTVFFLDILSPSATTAMSHQVWNCARLLQLATLLGVLIVSAELRVVHTFAAGFYVFLASTMLGLCGWWMDAIVHAVF